MGQPKSASSAPAAQQRDSIVLLVAVALVVGVKAWILAKYWNDQLGDWGRLEAFANTILTSSNWLHDAGIDREALPPELWKTPGYPLLIAGAKAMLGSHWSKGIMVLASLLSLVAGLYVRSLALALKLPATVATLAFVLFSFSVPASTDVLLMPDGLYGSLATAVICAIGARHVTRGSVSTGAMLTGGLVIAVCFLVREGFLYLVIPLALALTVPIWWSGTRLRRAVILLIVFCLPTFLTAAGILTWNRYRTGDYVMAMVTEIVYLIAVLRTAEKDPTVFAGNTPLDIVARSSASDYDYGDSQRITDRLFREYGLKAPEIYRIAERKFVETIIQHPRAYLLTVAERLRFGQQASMTGDLLMRLDDLEYWRFVNYGKDYYAGWRAAALQFRTSYDFSLLTPDVVVQMVPRLATRALSILMFLLFVAGLPLVALAELRGARAPGADRRAKLLICLYGYYWAVLAVYLLVNTEIRYFGPICMIPIVGSLVVADRICRIAMDLRPGAKRQPA